MSNSWKLFSLEGFEKLFSLKVLKHDLSEILAYILIIVYTIIFSYYTTLKYNAFRAYAWDLGIFNQALWTTLHDGKLFYYTAELFVNPSGSFLGSHFSPILFLVLPVYSLYPRPETLLVFQSLILALGALPLYYFTRETLDNRTGAIVFVLAYLIYTPLHGVNWFDFHVQAFLPVLFFSVMYFLRRARKSNSHVDWLFYFVFILLSLSVAENVPLVVFFIGLYCAWLYRRQLIQSVREKKLSNKRVLVPIITMTIAVLWLLLATWTQRTYFPIDAEYSHFYKAVDNWSVLGIQDDPVKIPLYAILHPAKVLNALAYDTYLKLVYVILLFGPLKFLSFKSSKTIITFVWLGPVLLSNYSPYYLIGSHFPAYIVAFIFLAAAEAVRGKNKINVAKITSNSKDILILGVFFLIFTSPVSPLLTTIRSIVPFFSDYSPPIITEHELMLKTVVNYVPANASILTQNNIFPHFSNRINAFVYPTSLILSRVPPEEIDLYINDLVQKSEYILVDNVTDPYITSLVINRTENNQSHGLYAFADGIYLFKSGYQDPPILYIQQKNVNPIDLEDLPSSNYISEREPLKR